MRRDRERKVIGEREREGWVMKRTKGRKGVDEERDREGGKREI